MIRLIRNDGVELLLNVDMIQSIEAATETTIILTTGERLVVKNHPVDITEKISAYRMGSQENDPDSPEDDNEKSTD